MAKWNKQTFMNAAREACPAYVVQVLSELVAFCMEQSDAVAWGRGEETGMITFRARSDEGMMPLFHLTTDGQIRFQINTLREKAIPAEILRDYQLKLESTFLLDMDEDSYPTDIQHPVDDLFHTHNQVEKFMHAIRGVTARLHQ